jgi:hypothetical protein
MNFGHRLLSTISYATPSTVSSAGDITYSATGTMSARILYKNDIVTAPSGEQLTTSTVVETETELPVGTKVWLPGASTGDANAAKRVIQREYAATLDGSYTLYIAYL